MKPLVSILLLLALAVRAGVTVFTCDPIPYGTNYNLYVTTTNGMTITPYTTNWFYVTNISVGAQVYVTGIDTNGFESDPSTTLVKVAVPPTGFKKK